MKRSSSAASGAKAGGRAKSAAALLIAAASLLSLSAFLASCATSPAPPSSPYRGLADARGPLTADELAVIASAQTLVGMAPDADVTVKGRHFQLDCIGTVSAIFWRMDIDVTKDFGRYSGNGVRRLFMTLRDRGVLHSDRYPRTGDIVIWDNTWDANGDGDRGNDPWTHAGVVLAVDEDGTIHYVHENLVKGVMVESMNLLRPEVAGGEGGKRLNSGLGIATVPGGPKPEHWLSGDLFEAFGDVLRIKEDLKVAGVEGPDAALLAMAR